MNFETWREIKDFPHYEVSDKGQVRNCKTGRILRPSKHNQGYLQVGLYSNGILKTLLVHRLLAETYLPNEDTTKDR